MYLKKGKPGYVSLLFAHMCLYINRPEDHCFKANMLGLIKIESLDKALRVNLQAQWPPALFSCPGAQCDLVNTTTGGYAS